MWVERGRGKRDGEDGGEEEEKGFVAPTTQLRSGRSDTHFKYACTCKHNTQVG